MAVKVPTAVIWIVIVLALCALAESRQQGCCYGSKRISHGVTVLTIPSCCVSLQCSDGEIVPTYFGGFGASGCCEFGGLLYPNGSQLSAHCSSLTCVNGNWTLTGRIQDCCAQCTLYNYGHISTFDNNHYHWAGPCNYSVTQTGTSPNPDVGVFTSFESCYYSFCLQQTTFKNDPNTVVTLNHEQPNAIFTILVNGDTYTVPHLGIHQVQIGTKTYPLLVWRTLSCIFLVGSSGLMLLHCPTRLDVWAYPTHSSQLHGLCGHFNFNALDDMTARDGTVHPVNPFPLAFPESWRTPEQSDYRCRQHCTDCTNPAKPDPCNASPETRKSYQVRCAKVLHPVLGIDKQLDHLVDSCELEFCQLHQAGFGQDLQLTIINRHLFVARISKIILAQTLGDFIPEPLFAPLNGMCTAGSSWQMDCNNCGCSDGAPAVSRCTRRACPEDFVPALGEEHCSNGSRWRHDCNVCECIRNGRVCSLNDCSETSPPVTQTYSQTPTQIVTFPPLPVCSLPKDAGTCSQFALKWYYDSMTGKCTQFFYSGCGGNHNRFNTEHECQLVCGNHLSTTTTESTSKPSGCFLAPEVGPCHARKLHYYYNPARDLCEQFFFGGCQAKFNNFETFEECRATCGGGGDPNATTTGPSVCHLGWDSGHCFGRQLKYYYNADTDQCFVAYYSGCGGNDNRFDSALECMQSCGGTQITTTTTACEPSFLACPQDCPITFVNDPESNCPKCVCNFSTTTIPTPITCEPSILACPQDCPITFVTDPATNCPKCICDFSSTTTLPPFPSHCPHEYLVCPTYCNTRYITDPSTGCARCVCDSPSLPDLF